MTARQLIAESLGSRAEFRSDIEHCRISIDFGRRMLEEAKKRSKSC